jgi:L-methionine (R)-S-oxide reductase
MNRASTYKTVLGNLRLMLDSERDGIAIMATVACELHQAFEHLTWTGFYRVTAPGLLTVGPYQGTHGCITIPFERGVCGAAARLKVPQIVDDVDAFDGHIACSSSTRSELVLPILNAAGETVAVLDLDSDHPAAFTAADAAELEPFCAWLGERL